MEGDEEPRDIDEKDIDKEASPETRDETSIPDKGKVRIIGMCSGLKGLSQSANPQYSLSLGKKGPVPTFRPTGCYYINVHTN